MDLKVLRDKLLLIEIPKENLIGNIIIADSVKQGQRNCKVICVGPDIKGIKVGDTVIISDYAGEKMIFDKIDYISANEYNVLAVLPCERS